MFAKILSSFRKPHFSTAVKGSLMLLSVGGITSLYARNVLAFEDGCISKVMETARTNQALIDAIGEPIVKVSSNYLFGLSDDNLITYKSATCSFPISGPYGSGVLKLKAVPCGDNTWPFALLSRDWEILSMDVRIDRTLRINLTDKLSPSSACTESVACSSERSEA